MKSILYIHHTSVVGGASYCLLSVLKEVDLTRYTPTVLLKEKGPLVEEIEKLGIKVEFLPSMTAVPYNRSLLRWKSIRTWMAVRKSVKLFRQWLKDRKYDVVYVNSMMLHPYLFPAKEAGIKTILHVREHWPENENRMQLDYAIRNISQNADRIISINRHSAKLFNNVKEKVTVVYDWIDFSQRYEPHPFKDIFGEGHEKLKVFLYTGGMQRIKGTYEVVETFSKHLKDENYRLLMMGCNNKKDNKGIKGSIKQFLSVFGIKSYEYKVKDIINSDNRIVCMPATYKVKDIIEQAYCVVNYFTIPHANLILSEGIILKSVVCAALTPESLEYSNGGRLAKLFPFKDKECFIKALKQIEKEHAEIKMRLEKESCIIEELFDKKRNAQILSNIYKEIIEV